MKERSLAKNITLFLVILCVLWFSGMILSLAGALLTGVVAGLFGILKLVFSKFGLAILLAALLVYIFQNRGSRQPSWH